MTRQGGGRGLRPRSSSANGTSSSSTKKSMMSDIPRPSVLRCSATTALVCTIVIGAIFFAYSMIDTLFPLEEEQLVQPAHGRTQKSKQPPFSPSQDKAPDKKTDGPRRRPDKPRPKLRGPMEFTSTDKYIAQRTDYSQAYAQLPPQVKYRTRAYYSN